MTTIERPNQKDFTDRCLASSPWEIVDFVNDERGSGKTWALLNTAAALSASAPALRGVLIGPLHILDDAGRYFRNLDCVYSHSRREFRFPNGSTIRVLLRKEWGEAARGMRVDWVGMDTGADGYPGPSERASMSLALDLQGSRRIMIVGER